MGDALGCGGPLEGFDVQAAPNSARETETWEVVAFTRHLTLPTSTAANHR